MYQPQIEQARARIHALRGRLQDIATLLKAEAIPSDKSAKASAHTLSIAAQAIEAVSDDLEAVCGEQLTAGPAALPDTDAAARARSEVNSGEFDSQG